MKKTAILLILFSLISLSFGKIYQSNYPLPKNNIEEIYKKTKNLYKIKEYLKKTNDFEKISIKNEKLILKKKPIVKKISIKGNKSFWKNEILAISGILQNHSFDSKSFKEIVLRLKQFYLDNGYPFAKIYVYSEIDRLGNASLKIDIKEGKKAKLNDVIFLTEKKLTEKEKKRYREILGLKKNKIIKFRDLQDKLDILSQYLREKGYFDNFVSLQSFFLEENGKVSVYIYITFGSKYVVKFQGNKAFNDKKLLKLLTFKEKGFNYFQLNESIERLKKLYQDNGYINVNVLVKVKRKENSITYIIFKIKEGDIYKITNIDVKTDIEGLSKKIKKEFEGKIYKKYKFKKYIEKIIKNYHKDGYLNASYKINESFDEENKTVFLSLEVFKGNKFVLKKVKFEGYTFRDFPETPHVYDSDLILQYLSKYKKLIKDKGYFDGDVLLDVKFQKGKDNIYYAEVIYKTILGERYKNGLVFIYGTYHLKPSYIKLNLSNSKYYDKDDFDLDLITFYSSYLFDYVNPSLDIYDKKVNKLLIFHEDKRGFFQGSFGYNTDRQFRVYGALTLKNLFGIGLETSFFSEVTNLGSTMFKYSIGDRLIPKRMSAFTSYFLSTEIHRIFDLRKKGYDISIEKTSTKHRKHGFIFEYTRNKIENTDVQIEKNRYKSLKLKYILTLDYRKPKVDTKKGLYSVIRLTKGFRDVDYVKTEFFGRYFYPIKNLIFTQRLGVGYIFDSVNNLLLSERYFLGGLATVRGFGFEEIKGKNGTGGKSFILINNDLKIPMYRPLNLYGLIFFDFGNVYVDNNDMNNLKLRQTMGIGITVPSPVGSIIFDIARKLDRKKGESLYRIELSIGAMF
jgi:outer membrane protein insertion porin family